MLSRAAGKGLHDIAHNHISNKRTLSATAPPHDVNMHTGQRQGPGKLTVCACAQGQEVRTLRVHGGRVGALAWGGPLLASGSWDCTVRLADVRAPGCGACLGSHASEVCGLKARLWRPACSWALGRLKAYLRA